MTATHKVVITCDTNDADYIDASFLVDMKNPDVEALIEADELFPGHKRVSKMQLLKALIEAIELPRVNRHQWSRSEFDSPSAARETCEWVFKLLFGVDVWNVDKDKAIVFDDPEMLLDQMVEIIQESLLPYGEFGVHTISTVSYSPLFSETYMYQEPPRTTKDKLAKTQLIIKLDNECPLLRFYEDENGQAMQFSATGDWIPTPMSLKGVRALATVIWEAKGAENV